jgi:TetR/AcrR family transcriptional regulator, transcriptional repressor for nem operon
MNCYAKTMPVTQRTVHGERLRCPDRSRHRIMIVIYAHFSSKDALLAKALEHYSAGGKTTLERGLVDASDRQWVHGIVDRYLDDGHRRHSETGWPIPSLAPEIGRARKASRQAFERLVGSRIAKIAAHLPLGDPEERASAITALWVGGMPRT